MRRSVFVISLLASVIVGAKAQSVTYTPLRKDDKKGLNKNPSFTEDQTWIGRTFCAWTMEVSQYRCSRHRRLI